MERVKGIEPSFQAWEAHVLPLNHTRIIDWLVFNKLRPNWQLVCTTNQTNSILPIASRSFSSINFRLVGELIFPSSTALT